MNAIQETILEIDLQKLEHNFEFIKSKINSETNVLAVVKAFAYGSDAEEIALYLQKLNVDYFAVAYTQEGVQLRNAGVTKPILVLHPQPIHFKTLINSCLAPSIYSFRTLNAFLQEAKKAKITNYPIHLKFNTGLNRLGFIDTDIPQIKNTLKENDTVKITSIFSHLAASDDGNEEEFTQKQIELFKQIKSNFEAFDSSIFYHLVNTSGILNYPEAHFNMVRCGIGLYGFGNDKKHDKQLQPIASLKSVISQIHTLQKGESLGYNRAFIATKITQTATIPIGHADGISRQYGNGNGFVIINNEKASIIGNVCMDMVMVNVTNINCNEGDTVIIYDGNHTAIEFSKTIGSISYEIITATSQRIKRVFKR